MKTLSFFIVCLLAPSAMAGQQPLSPDQALAQLYHGYNAKEGTAHWVCPHQQNGEGWPCSKDDSTVNVSQVLVAEIAEGDAMKTYLVASSVPVQSPDRYDCHSCAPAIGVAVFAWKSGSWVLQSANPVVGFYGGWGDPPEANLATIGPEKHGVVLSESDGGQGYAWSTTVLLAPVGKLVAKVWSTDDEQDDFGAYDPAGVNGPKMKYRSSAALKFVVPEDYSGEGVDYYDIEVISRGRDQPGTTRRLKSENWTEIYRYSDGKYRLLKHTDFSEIRKTASYAAKKH